MGAALSTPARADDATCPVDHKNMSKQELDGMMAQYKRLGHAEFAAQHNARAAARPDAPAASAPSEASGCPVDHANMSKDDLAAYASAHGGAKAAADGGAKATPVYDVYGQELDSANMMPATPNQLPSPGQKRPLSTDRVKSSIPKGGEAGGETWTYPSPQMFYNALKRKGKADDVDEADMENVVSVHNGMNERTWDAVREWERRFHCAECADPKLKKFMGRPHDLSPAARFRVWFRGYPMPFDRHDWTVDRCGKEDVRYVIDYYYRDGPDPIEIHVRPAVDSVGAVYDRLRNRVSSAREAMFGESQPAPLAAAAGRAPPAHSWQGKDVLSGSNLGEGEFAFLSNLTPSGIQEIAADAHKRCSKVAAAFRDAGDDPVKMEKAHVSVNYCMAQGICKAEAAGFMSALEGGGDETAAYGKMASCLERFHIVARRVLLEDSGVAQSGPEFPAGVATASPAGATPAPASSVE